METVGVAAVSLLTAFLVKTGKPLAERAGEKLAEKVGELYQATKKKFRGNSYAEETLTRAEEKPEDGNRQAVLKGVLTELMQDDTEFAELVQRLVSEAKEADTGNVVAYGDRSVVTGGDVTGSIIITGDQSRVERGGS